jgi:hypothetical protein
MMLDIAERFMSQAQALDQRVQAAVDANASHGDIVALMNLATTDRLRALTACHPAAPFCSPKLRAIEIAPASESTVTRFERAITNMSEDEVANHLRAIATGASELQLIEAGDDNT